MSRLLACWVPPRTPPAPGDAVLSFLPPADEERFAREFRGELLLARAESVAVRAEARSLYLRLGAEIGASRDASGRTLRELCGGEPSSWWWHPSSFKDPEADPAFGLIIAALTVLRAAAGREVTLVGAPAALSLAFRGGKTRGPGGWVCVRALAARALGALRALREVAAASVVPAAALAPGGAALLGFWDWSPTPAAGGALSDRYYKALPKELARRGLAPYWLCWLDPEGDPGARGRSWRRVLRPLAGRSDVVLLQRWLGLSDVLGAYADLRPALAYLRRRRDPAFRALFRRGSLDLWPLFSERLLRGFLDGCLPRCELVRRAGARAAAALRPALVASFLEHFPFARALYAGVREGAPAAVTAAVQHASYAPEKTFLFLDPALEFGGDPDGLPVPVPDLALAMGSASREHFLSCGYAPERVLLTGSPRYDSLRSASEAPRAPGPPRVLCVATLSTEVEIDMIEAAAAAAAGVPGAQVAAREHPFARLSSSPRFPALAGSIRITSGSLAEDLAWADVVLFTYSTVAEEAALQGKTVWQWRPLSYDASALAAEGNVRRFASVAALREALAAFRPEPLPPEEKERLAERLFFRLDGGAAARAADALAAAARRRG